jgi:TolB-like protein
LAQLFDIFISYARSTDPQAEAIAEGLRALGFEVWRDDALPAHRAYSDVIEERLAAAKAVVVVWSAEAVKSHWVRSEADRARLDGKIVQVAVETVRLPMPFDQIQCADLSSWTGEAAHAGWRKAVASISDLASGGPTSPELAAPRPTPADSPPLPDKPSIAVLPFADPGGAAEGDYFADGMVQEIATTIARFPSLFVISSGSSLSYRGGEHDFARIGRELGVRYLLEGAVRRSGPRVRISVTLIEASLGAQIWAERFEGTLEDVFALQDEVAGAVAARIEPSIQAADLKRAAARPTEDLGAYDLFLRAMQLQIAFDRRSWEAALALYEECIARDPNYAEALARAANIRSMQLIFGWADDPMASAVKVQDYLGRALRAGGGNPEVLVFAAFVSIVFGGDRAAADTQADRGLALNPGAVMNWIYAGWVSVLTDKPEIGIERFQQALRLDPRGPDRHSPVWGTGAALAYGESWAEALPWLEEAVALRPDYPPPWVVKAAALARLGRMDEAKASLARYRDLAELEAFLYSPTMSADRRERLIAALRLIEPEI